MKRLLTHLAASALAIGMASGLAVGTAPAAQAATCSTWQYKTKPNSFFDGGDLVVGAGWYFNVSQIMSKGYRYGNLYSPDKKTYRINGVTGHVDDLDYVTCW